MREFVIVIPDLYLAHGGGQHPALPENGSLGGLEFAGRFGTRTRLVRGWRGWLAGWLGHPELAGAAVGAVAAAGLPGGDAVGTATRWMATPLELHAGLARVHLEHRGLVRLRQDELVVLAAEFHRVFAGSGHTLTPLGDGNLLLTAPGIAPVATLEPARFAGGVVRLPQGPAAGPLLRLATEIEMWLHGAPFNERRRTRGLSPVTALWLWGGEGAALPARARLEARPDAPLAFGSDAYLRGLWHLHGGPCRALPGRLEDALTAGGARTVLVVEAGGELPQSASWTIEGALVALDGRVVQPALRALREGHLGRVLLVANDTLLTLGPRSGLKGWRRRRAGLTGFA